ncbi:MAG TPA: hypothetical protein VFH15_08220 [Pyrinomonadaceae bacterium]|nr:hypothetical protein [Pyrinomonadaceae bacterium]
MYRSLDAEKIILTVKTLSTRIEERFPGSGLNRVCAELHTVAVKSQQRSSWIAKPLTSLRLLVALLITIMIAGLAMIVRSSSLPRTGFDLVGLVQVSEAGLNVVILLGAGILFLITTERRIKRGRALKAIHELRALAHVIDMHQLTKDPERALVRTKDTASSPKQTLTPAELTRYLDYCSEMLSLIGKLAALYVQQFDDPVALAAVNDVEQLTNGLSRKIWQKISILNTAQSQPHV